MSIQKRISLTSLGLLVVGAIGYFSLPRDLVIFYVFAHLGALGVMGLLGCAAGAIAERKSRSFTLAFGLGFMLPILAGIVAVLVFFWGVNGQWYCGGSVSLAIALSVILVYLLAVKRTGKPIA